MFQIAIVDDRAEDAEALARMVRACRRSSEACATGEGISTFATVDALSARMDGGYAPDIVFVDMVLDPDAAQDGPAPTGIDAVERLFGTGSAAQIVYVSGYDEFHTKVYRTRPIFPSRSRRRTSPWRWISPSPRARAPSRSPSPCG